MLLVSCECHGEWRIQRRSSRRPGRLLKRQWGCCRVESGWWAVIRQKKMRNTHFNLCPVSWKILSSRLPTKQLITVHRFRTTIEHSLFQHRHIAIPIGWELVTGPVLTTDKDWLKGGPYQNFYVKCQVKSQKIYAFSNSLHYMLLERYLQTATNISLVCVQGPT